LDRGSKRRSAVAEVGYAYRDIASVRHDRSYPAVSLVILDSRADIRGLRPRHLIRVVVLYLRRSPVAHSAEGYLSCLLVYRDLIHAYASVAVGSLDIHILEQQNILIEQIVLALVLLKMSVVVAERVSVGGGVHCVLAHILPAIRV